MAKKKKKKKKPQPGARKPTYAKGKKVEPEKAAPAKKQLAKAPRPAATGEKTAASGAEKPAAKGAVPAGKGKPGGAKATPAQEQPQFNLVKRGTVEMKVLLYLLAVLAVFALLQYPLFVDDADTQYKDAKKTYQSELKKFEQKYETPEEQKKHEKEKPLKPYKASGTDFILSAMFLILQSLVFAFLGLNVQRRTDLKTDMLDEIAEGQLQGARIKDLLTWSVPFAAAALVPLVISALVTNSTVLMKKSYFLSFDTWKTVPFYMNAAVTNLLIFVFFLFSVLVWVFMRYRDKTKVEPHWASLPIVTALFYGYYAWASTAGGISTGTALVTAAFLSVSLISILGYLYWRKGLEYSLLAGVIGFGLYPFIANLIVK